MNLIGINVSRALEQHAVITVIAGFVLVFGIVLGAVGMMGERRHKWSDWAVTERGKIVTYVSEREVGHYIVQERFCTVCGKIQVDDYHWKSANGMLTNRRPDIVRTRVKHDIY